MNLKDYYRHFHVDEKIIQEIIDHALSRGGDYSDIYFQHSISNYIGLEDGAVNRAYSDISLGVGIRVLRGEQTGYSFSEEISPSAMKLAAKTAANIANAGQRIAPVKLKLHQTPNYYAIENPWENVTIDQKIPYLHEINEKVFAEDSHIIKSSIWFSNETSYILMANSEGRIVFDYQPMGQIVVSCIAEQNGQREQN